MDIAATVGGDMLIKLCQTPSNHNRGMMFNFLPVPYLYSHLASNSLLHFGSIVDRDLIDCHQ